jgi:hypothetical protein
MALTKTDLANIVEGILPVANGGTGSSSGVFPSGTVMLFVQTAAPTGWTKSTANDNKALRVVSGSASTGGSVAFTTAFASQAVSGTVGTSGATTLTIDQIPSHTHSYTTRTTAGEPSTNSNISRAFTNATPQTYSVDIGSTGGGNSHTHSGGSFTGTAINLAVQYVDVIIATKD